MWEVRDAVVDQLRVFVQTLRLVVCVNSTFNIIMSAVVFSNLCDYFLMINCSTAGAPLQPHIGRCVHNSAIAKLSRMPRIGLAARLLYCTCTCVHTCSLAQEHDCGCTCGGVPTAA